MTPSRIILSLGLLLMGMLSTAAESAVPLSKTVEIVINKRTFSPEVTTIGKGEHITLILRNEDGDLHAFVPLLLFKNVNVQVRGNGAPQFTEDGFARVLIPPHGQAELAFVPKTIGTFFYICDLPGHNMRGEIIIRDSASP
jgi:uncharacterized cupredoxin-like copper-binding protein